MSSEESNYEESNERIIGRFKERYGVKESRGVVCWQRLLGKRCPTYQSSSQKYDVPHVCYPPHSDHVTLWNKNGKPHFLVSQPYGPWHYNRILKIGEFCEKNNLEFLIDAWPSWHYPGRVLTVIFKAKGVDW